MRSELLFYVSHRSVILSGAFQPLGRGVEGPRGSAFCPNLLHLFYLERSSLDSRAGKDPNIHGEIKSLGVLRLLTSQKARGAPLRMTFLWEEQKSKANSNDMSASQE
jgi:hypothetical protein